MDFYELCEIMTIRDACEYARRFCKMITILKTNGSYDNLNDIDNAEISVDGLPQGIFGASPQAAVTYCRLALGALVEEFAACEARTICNTQSLPTGAEASAAFAQLCMDSYLAAVWTDAHACYLKVLTSVHDSYAQRRRASESSQDADPPTYADELPTMGQPYIKATTSISSCPNVSAELNKNLQGGTSNSIELKELMSILVKANQSGNRGWEGMVSSINKLPAIKAVCSKTFLAGCVAMHPNIHPAARPCWDERLLLLSVLTPVVKTSFVQLFNGCHVATKECIRNYSAMLMDDVSASREALLVVGNPMGVFQVSSNCLANPSVHASAQMVVGGAREAARQLAALTTTRAALAPVIVCDCMQGAFSDTRPPSAAGGSLQRSHGRYSELKSIVYSPSWASRLAFYARPSKNDEGVNAMDLGAEMLIRCFKTEFIPFWIHGHSHDSRVGRLDPSQKQSMHRDACGRVMTDCLSRLDILKLVRMVWRCRYERFLSVDQVFEKLEADAETCSRLRQATTIDNAIDAIYNVDALQVARFLTFCKLVSIKYKFFAYDLGETTKRMQLAALRKRFNIQPGIDDNAAISELPDHAKKIHLCLECCKTSNACVTLLNKSTLHDELGIAQTMLRVGAIGDTEHVRCAKRSSAAYRTAIAKQEAARKNRVELKPVSIQSLQRGFKDNGDSSHLQRLRRDLYTCALQSDSATGCGDTPVVLIPLIGKAIRIGGKWLAICSFCASITRVDASRRYEGQICCRRCDPAMLGEARPPPPTPAPGMFDNLEVEPNCRYCNKAPPIQAVSRFRLFRSPSDYSGRNGAIPETLRSSFYCTSHARPWLETALNNHTDIRIIFSHILNRATPVWGAEAGSKVDEMSEAAEAAKRRRQTIDRKFRKVQRSTTR
jgi:hypothetical protein